MSILGWIIVAVAAGIAGFIAWLRHKHMVKVRKFEKLSQRQRAKERHDVGTGFS